MGNCLVTKLKEAVNNSDLKKFDRVRIIISFPGNEFTYITRNGANKNGVAGEFISGALYNDSARTIPVTSALPISMLDYHLNDLYNGSQIDNPEHTISVIDLSQSNIWAVQKANSEQVLIGTAGTEFVWWHADLNALCYSAILLCNCSTLYLRSGETFRVEEFFEKKFQYIKSQNNRGYEDVTLKKWYPCILNNEPYMIAFQERITFNGQRFFNKKLFMATDLDNDTFTIYDTPSDYDESSGFNISNMVASCNMTTGEWTYL